MAEHWTSGLLVPSTDDEKVVHLKAVGSSPTVVYLLPFAWLGFSNLCSNHYILLTHSFDHK